MKVARICEEVTGKYHVCDDSADYIDTRGRAYNSRRQAIAALRDSDYTHYRHDDNLIKIKIKRG